MARPPIRYRAILFAGAPRYFASELGGLARSYVESGGRIAWLGTGGFTLQSGTLFYDGNTAATAKPVFPTPGYKKT